MLRKTRGRVRQSNEAYCGSRGVFMVLGALFVRGEASVIGTSSASLILARRPGARLSTIGALCKYRLQPHQLRVQLAELERVRGAPTMSNYSREAEAEAEAESESEAEAEAPFSHLDLP
ncbi:hypothetical protein M0802_001430 [Mischocyttarus mexicanus]|nr:hypothetical protein M0802_001430 [Mischocyttarus mexicanus]